MRKPRIGTEYPSWTELDNGIIATWHGDDLVGMAYNGRWEIAVWSDWHHRWESLARAGLEFDEAASDVPEILRTATLPRIASDYSRHVVSQVGRPVRRAG